MSAKPRDLGMTSLDDLFSTDESRAEAQLEKVVTLNPADISDFPNHPFKMCIRDRPFTFVLLLGTGGRGAHHDAFTALDRRGFVVYHPDFVVFAAAL